MENEPTAEAPDDEVVALSQFQQLERQYLTLCRIAGEKDVVIASLSEQLQRERAK